MQAPTSRYGCGSHECVACSGDAEWQMANIRRLIAESTNDDEIADLEFELELMEGM